MSETAWITIVVLAGTSAAIKATGPVLFGSRPLPTWLSCLIPYLAPALFAALVISETVTGRNRTVTIDARSAGLAGAALAVACRASPFVAAIVAACTTALVRAIV